MLEGENCLLCILLIPYTQWYFLKVSEFRFDIVRCYVEMWDESLLVGVFYFALNLFPDYWVGRKGKSPKSDHSSSSTAVNAKETPRAFSVHASSCKHKISIDPLAHAEKCKPKTPEPGRGRLAPLLRGPSV